MTVWIEITLIIVLDFLLIPQGAGERRRATAMPDPDWWGALWPQPTQVLTALGIRLHMEVVDLCCGNGLFTAPLALLCRRGIDIDQGMLAVAQEKIQAIGAVNFELIEGNAYAVAQLVGRPVDYVLIANTFHGVPVGANLRRDGFALAGRPPSGSF